MSYEKIVIVLLVSIIGVSAKNLFMDNSGAIDSLAIIVCAVGVILIQIKTRNQE
ncbi:hypothetical protein [Aliarcobacter vitoriensis]|uniref:hypothetical protein n=1 Tax=Aliarcobacter vitoriensis TaxID=2011099 RepID=UPI001C9BF577|nr:hypothetical protein [Aliarcobacter vitoriensis]